jgi:hypothetical protein
MPQQVGTFNGEDDAYKPKIWVCLKIWAEFYLMKAHAIK